MQQLAAKKTFKTNAEKDLYDTIHELVVTDLGYDHALRIENDKQYLDIAPTHCSTRKSNKYRGYKLAMEYKDPNPIDTSKAYSPAELAEFIRTKMYGKDVREAIALGVEQNQQIINVLALTGIMVVDKNGNPYAEM